jgi:ABC-type multidrug transport system ATPase subunit
MEIVLDRVHFIQNVPNIFERCCCVKEEDTITHLVSDISLKIPRGSLNYVIGPSGSGKSTLLRLLGRVIEPTSGSIHSIFPSENDIKRKQQQKAVYLGHPMAQTYLDDNQDVYESILFAYTSAYGQDYPTSYLRNMVADALQALELEHLKHKKYKELSLGQQARTLLLLGLAQTPSILVLDELTDCLSASELKSWMTFLVSKFVKGGMTIFIGCNHFAHIFEEEDLNSNLICMAAGSVMFAGPLRQSFEFFRNASGNPLNDQQIVKSLETIVSKIGTAILQFKEFSSSSSSSSKMVPSKLAPVEEKRQESWNIRHIAQMYQTNATMFPLASSLGTPLKLPPLPVDVHDEKQPLAKKKTSFMGHMFLPILKRHFQKSLSFNGILILALFVALLHLMWPPITTTTTEANDEKGTQMMEKANLMFACLLMTTLLPCLSLDKWKRASAIFTFEHIQLDLYTPTVYLLSNAVFSFVEAFLNCLPFLVLFVNVDWKGSAYFLLSMHYATMSMGIQSALFFLSSSPKRSSSHLWWMLTGLPFLASLLLAGNIVPRAVMDPGMLWFTRLTISEVVYSSLIQMAFGQEPFLVQQILGNLGLSLASTILKVFTFHFIANLSFCVSLFLRLPLKSF